MVHCPKKDAATEPKELILGFDVPQPLNGFSWSCLTNGIRWSWTLGVRNATPTYLEVFCKGWPTEGANSLQKNKI